ncbi:hypothetical protein R1flu_012201 [Riccia fluitans]|uniref:MBD domain-containing protein n=1 Tax=Riccia fluitans TaxID=41844 RepID=A0ABD1ZCE3_9MARC
MVKAHPLAGKSGEGPPLAPELWKWRAGNRINDMYFTAPTGERFRSRSELNNYLATIPNPPPADSFQWRVTEEFLAEHQVAFWDSKTPSKQGGDGSLEKQAEGTSKKKEAGSSKKKEAVAKNKTEKRKEVPKSTPDVGRKKVKLDPSSPLPKPSVRKQIDLLPTPEPVSKKDDLGVADLFTTPPAKPRPKLKATKKDKLDKSWEDHEFFTRVLASKASWKWLYDTEAAAKFLAEAEKLKEKSDLEINDLRNMLLQRGSDMNNISKYSNQVLRIFVQILRNVEPPSSMGKVELSDLVVNWKCKRKNFWCLLETSRLAPPPQAGTVSAKEDVPRRVSIPASQDRRNSGSFGGKSAQDASGRAFHESDPANEELELEFTLRDIQETVKDIEETQLTTENPNPPVDVNMEACTSSDGTARRTGPSESMYKVQYQNEVSESVLVLDRITGNNLKNQRQDKAVKPPRSIDDGKSSGGGVSKVVDVTQMQQTFPFPPNYHFPRESSVCWCKVCSRDQAFCRGCMCCLCPGSVKPEDEWRAVRCSFCKHLCHVTCALENNLAGAVQHLNLDGELACPSCSGRVDLWPFFVQSFDLLRRADKKSTSQDLEAHAGLVLQLLDGTQNKKYAFFRNLVTDLHDITSKLAIQDLVRQLLLGITEELNGPLCPDSDGMRVAEEALEDARKKRLEIVPLFDSLQKEYKRVTEQAGRIRAAQVSDRVTGSADEQPRTVDDDAASTALEEQINSQTKKAEQEFQKLMQFKSSTVHPDTPTLAGIDCSMNTWMDAVRDQRRTVEAAETELHCLRASRKRRNGI